MQFIERMLSVIAPHYCTQCGQEGQLLCASCLQKLCSQPPTCCALCGVATGSMRLCASCRSNSPFASVWYLGAYQGQLEELIHRLKFTHARAASQVLADGLLQVLPPLPQHTIVVPLPTSPRRVRQRGYDQSVLLAKHLAKGRGMTYAPLLRRMHHKRQVGTSKAERERQAANAYAFVEKQIDRDRPLLLVDDVLTTGASLYAAARVLQQAGYTELCAAVVARAA